MPEAGTRRAIYSNVVPNAGKPRQFRDLAIAIAAGVTAGMVYALFNRSFDHYTAFGRLPSSMAPAHDFFDLVLPVVVGGVLGGGAHYLRVRTQLATAARVRAEQLDKRLSHLERSQAAWVLSASVLHEVKNPLHALGLLLDDLGDATSDDERAAILARARAHVDRIAARLSELRALDAGAGPRLGTVAVADLARDLAGEVGPIARRIGAEVRVSAEGAPKAHADPAYVQVILENLVHNALDSLEEHGVRGAVDVDVKSQGDRVVVRVKDDGPGPPADVDLFAPLRSTKPNGMGLGLPLARALARACGGDVQHGDGSCFVLEREGDR